MAMKAGRVRLLNAESAPPEAREIMAKLPPLNIFRTMAHGGALLPAFVQFGNFLLMKTKLDPVLREIAIIRVGVLSRAPYEVAQHEKIGRDIGMSDVLLAAIHEGPDARVFDDVQRMIMRFTDDVVKNVRAGDATYQPLAACLSLQEMQELIVTIGFYMLVSRFLETFDVSLDGEGAVKVNLSRNA